MNIDQKIRIISRMPKQSQTYYLGAEIWNNAAYNTIEMYKYIDYWKKNGRDVDPMLSDLMDQILYNANYNLQVIERDSLSNEERYSREGSFLRAMSNVIQALPGISSMIGPNQHISIYEFLEDHMGGTSI